MKRVCLSAIEQGKVGSPDAYPESSDLLGITYLLMAAAPK